MKDGLEILGGPPPAEQFYSNTRGDADHQIQTGNILVTDSDRAATQMGGAGWSRIVEVSHSDPPQVVFDLHMRDDDLSDGKDQMIDVSKVDVSMDGIELEDREFIAAIREKRQPNGALEQLMPCMRTLHKLEQIIDPQRKAHA